MLDFVVTLQMMMYLMMMMTRVRVTVAGLLTPVVDHSPMVSP